MIRRPLVRRPAAQPALCRTMVRQFMFRRLALGCPYSKPSTAEDGLRRPAAASACRTKHSQYSRRSRPTQRCDRASNRPAVRLLAPCVRVGHVQALGWFAKHKLGDNTAHSGPPAATTTEAHVFQRSCAGGTDTLPGSHIPGSKIPRKTGSKRVGQGESQIPPAQDHSNPV